MKKIYLLPALALLVTTIACGPAPTHSSSNPKSAPSDYKAQKNPGCNQTVAKMLGERDGFARRDKRGVALARLNCPSAPHLKDDFLAYYELGYKNGQAYKGKGMPRVIKGRLHHPHFAKDPRDLFRR